MDDYRDFLCCKEFQKRGPMRKNEKEEKFSHNNPQMLHERAIRAKY
jgi:hypothetical protein